MNKSNIKSSLAAITDLLMQPYPLDPGSIEFLIEEATSIVSDGPARIAFDIFLNHDVNSHDNLKNFICRAITNRTIYKYFENSTKPAGRCPATKREWLKQLLSSDAKISDIASIIPTSEYTSSYETLDLSDVRGGLDALPVVIDRVSCINKAAQTIDIYLNDFTYASTLAVIAQWLLFNKLTNAYYISNTPQEMLNYLERIRFDSALKDSEIVIAPDPTDWAIGLTRINKDSATEKVTEKLVDIITTFVSIDVDDKSALNVLISEMIENVHRHSKSLVDGFAVAQLYPKKLKMAITLVDAGIGVRKSFEEGNPSVNISSLLSDEDFLMESIKLHSTSKKDKHTGYGLYLLSELIGRNRGTFLLSSGTATIVGYQKDKAVHFDKYNHGRWGGTIVSLILDLNNSLPLTEIYKSMPMIEGYDEDDFFID